MFDEPHLSIAPLEIFALMRDWLAKDVVERAPYPPSTAKVDSKLPDGATARIGEDGARRGDRALQAGRRAGCCSRSRRAPSGARRIRAGSMLLDRARGAPHRARTGSGCASPASSRQAGYASLRLDGRSVGDSDGDGNGLMPNEEYYQEHI